MCGIVGGVAERCVTDILIEGLKRLEYRGYDSAGLALLNNQQDCQRGCKAQSRYGVCDTGGQLCEFEHFEEYPELVYCTP